LLLKKNLKYCPGLVDHYKVAETDIPKGVRNTGALTFFANDWLFFI